MPSTINWEGLFFEASHRVIGRLEYQLRSYPLPFKAGLTIQQRLGLAVFDSEISFPPLACLRACQ